MTQAKLQKASATSLVTAAAILEDKARLVRGQALNINITALLDVLEVIRQKDQPEKYPHKLICEQERR